MRGKGNTFFTRKETERRLRYSSPPCPAVAFGEGGAPLTLSRKAKNFFSYVLPTHVWNRTLLKK